MFWIDSGDKTWAKAYCERSYNFSVHAVDVVQSAMCSFDCFKGGNVHVLDGRYAPNSCRSC